MKLFVTFLITVGFSLIHSAFAYAQTYEVRIRQIKPDGPVAEAICINIEKNLCFMTVEIDSMAPKQAGDEAYLDIGMRFHDDRVNFNFLSDRSSVYINTYQLREKGVDIFLNRQGQGYKSITLSTRSDVDEQESLTIKETPPEWPLAHIEIGVRRVPDSATE
jgi:hypothetical protein